MTPESLPWPPRRVRGKLGGVLWFGRIFMLPHTLIGIGAASYLLFMLLWRVAGADVPGQVTGSEISHSRKGGDRYILKYQYRVNGQTKSGADGVSRTVYERYPSGNAANPPVPVRYFSIGPLAYAKLHEDDNLWAGIGFLALWVAFWNFVVSIFLYQYWITPLRTRRLYRMGEATLGTVLRKKVKTGKSTTCYATYAFHDPFSGKVIETEMTVWNVADWQQVVEGQPVTVLYAADNPKRSTVYELGGYRVESDDATAAYRGEWH